MSTRVVGPRKWQPPACSSVRGTYSVTFTRDEGATLASAAATAATRHERENHTRSDQEIGDDAMSEIAMILFRR